MLGGGSWPPTTELFDFLKIMDMQDPDLSRQRASEEKVEEGGDSFPARDKYPHTEL